MSNDFPGSTPALTEIARGDQARAALDNPLIAEALSAWEQEITAAWQTSPLRDTEGRERLRLMLEAAKVFKKHLSTVMETGQLRKVDIRRKNEALERARGLFRRAA